LRDKEISCLIDDNYGYVWMTGEGDILLDVEDYDVAYAPGTYHPGRMREGGFSWLETVY